MRKNLFRSITALAGVALLTAACGESASSSDASGEGNGDGTTLTLAAVPSEESTSLQSQFEVLIKHLEEETGTTIEVQQATDYAAVVEGQRAGKIDIAAYGPFSYIIAADGGIPLQPLAAVIDEEGEEPGYFSGAYVLADSEIQDLEEARDKRVCFVDRASTSGYLYPSAGLLDIDIDPAEDVTEVLAGGHDASLLALKNGECDIAYAFEDMEGQLVEGGELEEGEVRQIWKSERIMGSPIAVNTDSVDAEIVEKLQEAFTTAHVDTFVEKGLCDSVEDCPLPEGAEWGFAVVEDGDYAGVREVCDITQAEACNV